MLLPRIARAAVGFAPCGAADLPGHAECAVVAVPDSPDDPAGSTVAIDVVRLLPTEGDPTGAAAGGGLIDLGDGWADAYRAACALWSDIDTPDADTPDTGTPDTGTMMSGPFVWGRPVLLLSGDVDPTAAPDRADPLLAGLEEARHVVLGGPAHGTPDSEACVGALLAGFIEAGTAKRLDARCAGQLRLPDFFVPEAAQPRGRPALRRPGRAYR